MKTILLNVYKNEVSVIDIQPELDEYYKNLECDLIDIVQRKIGGKWFDVMCDDEGLFNESQKISAITNMGEPIFVGNLMFFRNDGEGNLIGLEDEDVQHIKDHIQTMYTRQHPEGYQMLTQCEYF